MTTAALSTGIELEYDTFGSPDDPALLLVMGFTRDRGLSTNLDGQRVDPTAVMA